MVNFPGCSFYPVAFFKTPEFKQAQILDVTGHNWIPTGTEGDTAVNDHMAGWKITKFLIGNPPLFMVCFFHCHVSFRGCSSWFSTVSLLQISGVDDANSRRLTLKQTYNFISTAELYSVTHLGSDMNAHDVVPFETGSATIKLKVAHVYMRRFGSGVGPTHFSPDVNHPISAKGWTNHLS